LLLIREAGRGILAPSDQREKELEKMFLSKLVFAETDISG